MDWCFLAAGAVAATIAAVADGPAARAAAGQDWPAFVLIAGLLLVGRVAEGDGLFAAAGDRLAGAVRSGWALYGGGMALVALVTAILNLDTSVAFLTPVFVHAARRDGARSRHALLVGCILLSNAGSLLLPGANLTNLIVLGPGHLPGSRFFIRMAPAWAAAAVVTVLVVGLANRSALGRRSPGPADRAAGGIAAAPPAGAAGGIAAAPPAGAAGEIAAIPWRIGLGAAAVAAAAVLVIAVRQPALAVLAVGVAAVVARVAARRLTARSVADALGGPLMLGLFGLAVALGTVGRAWAGPTRLLAHAGSWGTAGVAALASVAVNNLPAASLLAARPPAHPYSLLVGLNVGPNLSVTGSLAWLLWLRVIAQADERPPLKAALRVGLVAAPLAIVAALLALAAAGHP